MLHPPAPRLSFCLLAVFSAASAQFASGSGGRLDPVIDRNPSYNDSATRPLEGPSALISEGQLAAWSARRETQPEPIAPPLEDSNRARHESQRGQRAEEHTALPEELEAIERDFKPVRALSTRIRPEEGELPENHAEARFAREREVTHRLGFSRAKLETQMSWEAPGLCHRPLYFEEINLERHGYKVPLVQPVLSAAHFFGRVPLLPYMMVSDRHRDCQYVLGHYRPGDYAPYSLYIPRPRLDATAAELAVAAGLIFAIP